MKESDIKKQIRNILRLLKVPHRNVVQGQFSDHGISDLIGVIPGSGRALFIEVKRPGHRKDTKTYLAQHDFLAEMNAAGALGFFCEDPAKVISALATVGFEPAKRMRTP